MADNLTEAFSMGFRRGLSWGWWRRTWSTGRGRTLPPGWGSHLQLPCYRHTFIFVSQLWLASVSKQESKEWVGIKNTIQRTPDDQC